MDKISQGDLKMPYIKPEDREKYYQIPATVLVIANQKDLLVRAEYFGFFVTAFIDKVTYNSTHTNSAFNCLDFDRKDKQNLQTWACKCADIIREMPDLMQQSGEINYLVSAIKWGVFGDAPDIPTARYGFRAFVKGMMLEIIDNFTIGTSVPSPDRLRLYLMVKGVLSDIIDETYRRKTSIYEDQKIDENGDLWPLWKGQEE